MSGGGGSGASPEQKRLQQLQLDEYDKVKATERRKLQALRRSRSGKISLMSGDATGIPVAKQSMVSVGSL